MPDASGKFKGISVPDVPWQRPETVGGFDGPPCVLCEREPPCECGAGPCRCSCGRCLYPYPLPDDGPTSGVGWPE